MFGAIKTVLWSFLGIRSSAGYAEDQVKLQIWQIIAAAVVCVVIFIFSLFFLVQFLTAK